MTDNNHLGVRIAQFRLDRNLSREGLAEASGVSQKQIERIESGVAKNPGYSTLCKLAAAFGVPLDTLISDR